MAEQELHKLKYLIGQFNCPSTISKEDITSADLNKCFIHPETNNEVLLSYNIGNYAWHSNYH